MADLNDLYRLANEYLESCVEALATTPQGAPERVYVSPGIPAFDCEQLTVHAGGPTIAPTSPRSAVLDDGHRIQVTGTVNMVLVTAAIVRCVPVAADDGKSAPAASEMDDASIVVLSDCWTIFNWTKRRSKAGALFGGECREVVVGTPIAFVPQGGLAGWQLPVLVRLDGYDPAAS